MVFRKGRYLGKKEVWYLGVQKLDVVSNYTYLGYTFTAMLSTNQSVNYLAMKWGGEKTNKKTLLA